MDEASVGGVAELDLRSYVDALRRRRALLVITAVAVLLGAVLWSFTQSERYEARARVLVAVQSEPSVFGAASPVVDPNRVVQTELLVFDSPQLREDVRRRVGQAPRISALQVDLTDVIEIVATSSTGRLAAAIANAYANAYIDLRRNETVREVVAAAEQLQAKISELQRQIDATSGDAQKAFIDQQALFRQKLDQLQVDGALRGGGARLVSDAAVPDDPVAPDRLRIALVALVFGILIGIGVALTVEYLDDSLHTVDDVQRAVAGLPVVGVLPVVEDWRSPESAVVASLRAPNSPAAEAVRTLRTSLSFLSLEHDVRVVQLTSAGVAEGKSSTVANLGVALARVGRTVVLVDCDLRRPRLHQFFSLNGTRGLTSVLAGEAQLRDVIIPVTAVPKLYVVPAGPAVAEPSELLASSRMADVVRALRAEDTIVLLDSPPVLPVADALVTAPLADATLVVCRSGRSSAKDLSRALGLLRQVNASLSGIILNAVPATEAYGGTYTYGRATEESEDQPRSVPAGTQPVQAKGDRS